MARKAVDNFDLIRWRSLDAASVLSSLADYVKQDRDFVPRASIASTRWHANVVGRDFEILCTGPKFLDARANVGGGGAVDLTMHLFRINFRQAVKLLRSKGL
jgi:hypothetical protein